MGFDDEFKIYARRLTSLNLVLEDKHQGEK